MTGASGPVVVSSLRIHAVRLPFRQAFGHHLARRRESRPQILQVILSDGTVGHGEALPRPYLTGETERSVADALHGPLAALVLEQPLATLDAVVDFAGGAAAVAERERVPAAFCALELALLDAAGRREHRSVMSVLGGAARQDLVYDGAVLGFMPLAALRLVVAEIKRRGKTIVKVKVGQPDDEERVQIVRRVLGDEAAIVLDANGAWTADEAVARIGRLVRYGLTAVEQPVARADLDGLALVQRATGIPVVADESICTAADASALLERKTCGIWNLRVGKCGGLLATREIARLAAANGVRCHLGVLVGESGILTAAGRLLAACSSAFTHLESTDGSLVRDDLLCRPLPPIVHNRAVAPEALPGLGIDINPQRLEAAAEADGIAEVRGVREVREVREVKGIVAVVVALLMLLAGSARAQTIDERPDAGAAATGPAETSQTGSGQDEPGDARQTAQPAEGGTGAGPALHIFGGQLTYRNDFRYELGNGGPSDSLFNPSHNVLEVASVSNLLRVNTALAFERDRFTVKSKLGAQYSHDLESASDFGVRELTVAGSFGNVGVSAGRKILKWSNGYAFSPAGLLDPVRSPSDPQDRLGRLAGRDLIQVDYYRGSQQVSGVLTSARLWTGPGDEPDRTAGLAFRYNILVRGLDIAAIGALNFRAANKAATTFSYVIGDRLEIHGEAAGSRGTETLYPQSILPAQQHTLFGADFLLPLKRDDNRLFLNYLLGANYTFSNGLNAVVEYYHSDEGLSGAEWARFLEQGRYASALAETQRFPPIVDGRSLPELNLLQALQLFRGQGLRRNYLFARFSHSRVFGGADGSAIGLVNLADHSVVLVPELSVPLHERAVLYGRASYFRGDAGSEYANVPVAYSASLGIRIHF